MGRDISLLLPCCYQEAELRTRYLGPYEIRAAIGAGGMGEVYRATDTKLNRDDCWSDCLQAIAPNLRLGPAR